MSSIGAFFGFIFSILGFIIGLIFSIIVFFFTHLLFFIIVGLIWAGWYGYRLMQEAASGAGNNTAGTPMTSAARIQNIDEVTTFAAAVSRVQLNNRLSSQQKLAQIASQYAESVERLEQAGKLTPMVETELRRCAEHAGAMVTGLTTDSGRSPNVLIRMYVRHRLSTVRRYLDGI